MQTRRSRRIAAADRPAFTALVVGILALLVLGALLIRDHGDASRLVHASAPWTSSTRAPSSLTVRPADQGYDGQFFYRLGVSPFSSAKQVAGVTFDLPALRNARWLSGALAWIGSGGQRDAVPWSLLGVNLLSAIGLGAAAGALAKSSGRHAAWGLILALYPGYAYTLTLDTSELLAGALVLSGIYAGRCRKWPVAAGLFIAAVLARDTAVAIPAGLALGGLIQLLRRRAEAWGPLLAGGCAVAVFAGWQVLQRVRFHAWPFLQSRKSNISGPFAGMAKGLTKDLHLHGGKDAFRLLSMVILLGVVIIALLAMRRTTLAFVERVAWFPAVIVVITLNAYLWSAATAFMRAGTEAYLVSGLVILGNRGRYAQLVAIPVVGLWLLTIGVQLAKG